jgi:hypothetical protein
MVEESYLFSGNGGMGTVPGGVDSVWGGVTQGAAVAGTVLLHCRALDSR